LAPNDPEEEAALDIFASSRGDPAMFKDQIAIVGGLRSVESARRPRKRGLSGHRA